MCLMTAATHTQQEAHPLAECHRPIEMANECHEQLENENRINIEDRAHGQSV